MQQQLGSSNIAGQPWAFKYSQETISKILLNTFILVSVWVHGTEMFESIIISKHAWKLFVVRGNFTEFFLDECRGGGNVRGKVIYI